MENILVRKKFPTYDISAGVQQTRNTLLHSPQTRYLYVPQKHNKSILTQKLSISEICPPGLHRDSEKLNSLRTFEDRQPPPVLRKDVEIFLTEQAHQRERHTVARFRPGSAPLLCFASAESSTPFHIALLP